ncbi:MAG: peptide deformylase [Alphaproteobacteria bacterium]|nr:peptide deformylase [Alphaproteobacteria bacterium]
MLQMKLCGDLVLREKCAPVSEITPELLQNMDEMVQMMEEQNGVGLAAPQVGIKQRFLVMFDPDTKTTYRMINPVITSKSEETVVLEEGCLSILNSENMPVFSDVERPNAVEVTWTDEKGKEHHAKMTGTAARIVQHEADHLDGVLFIDYLPSVKREMLMRKVMRRHA